jgi:hypothetical protein
MSRVTVMTVEPLSRAMAASGTPTDGFPSGTPDAERDSWRLLYLLLLLLGAGAGAILALDLELL